jgi:putative heme-binding domain-containing protein
MSTRELLKHLTKDAAQAVRHEALRSLRVSLDEKETRDRPPAHDVDAWLKLLDGPADGAAGERIFYHSKAGGCYRCHRFDGRGSDIGPDLSLTAGTLDRRRLVESILQPSVEIAPLYFVWNIETEDGRSFTGTLIHENESGEQTYADAQGKLIKLRIEDIAKRASQKRSIMPDDVAKTLTLQELRDLLAFLQKSAPAEKKERPREKTRRR